MLVTDWFDLDTPLLIAHDPFAGLSFGRKVRFHLPNRAGIGALHRA